MVHRRLLPAAGTVAALACLLAGCATGEPADADAIAAHADAAGIAPDLVYTTEVDGYDLAPQSVGPGAETGMTATWFNQGTGAMLTIRTDHGEMTAASCADMPLWDAPEKPVTCAEDGGLWQRSAGERREVVVVRNGALIRVTGTDGTPATDLTVAAKAAHVPSDAELDLLFADLPDAPATPVERGDLPEDGDGAPIDSGGPGG